MAKLYLVGTPIGNLGDISQRALEVLNQVDFIAAEDTRVTLKLLNRFEISKPMISYFEHNIRQRGEQIAQRILNGESCALVTDAGMPAISDPGEDLVKLCAELSIEMESVPGPSALVTALALSGLDSKRFCFEGFLSTNKQNRREHLISLESESRTMVFYEAPHKLKNTLSDFSKHFGDTRKISLCRELTKFFEEVIRTTIEEAIMLYKDNPPRGEFVLVVAGKEKIEKVAFLGDAVALAESLVEGGMAPAPAAKESARITGCRKSEIYKQLVDNKAEI